MISKEEKLLKLMKKYKADEIESDGIRIKLSPLAHVEKSQVMAPVKESPEDDLYFLCDKIQTKG